MKTQYRFISFVERGVEPIRKTKVWDCLNQGHGYHLGIIRWDGGWRQYVFAPATLSLPIFSTGCLADIQDFIRQAMQERGCPPPA